MKKLVVLGNGFDLAVGQKTHVYDFYEKKIRQNLGVYWQPRAFELDFLSFLFFECSDGNNSQNFRSILKVVSAEEWKDFELILNRIVLNEDVYYKIEEIFNARNDGNPYHPENAVLASINNYIANYMGDHPNDSATNYIDFLSFEVERFEREFSKYLMTIDVDHTWLAKKKLLLKEIVGRNESVIMTFNYTSPGFTDCDPTKVYAIHGTARANNAFIGIDATTNKEFKKCSNLYEELGEKIKFTKTFKRLTNSSFEQQNILKNDIDVITFYGHSLGEQDYSYFQSIFDHYSLFDSKLILEFCYSEYNDEEHDFEYKQLLARIARLINKYGETLDNKDHGKNLLNKLMLEGRIKVRKIDVQEVVTDEKVKIVLEGSVS